METGRINGGVNLVGDIGGTNARFALADVDSDAIHSPRTLPVADFPTLEDAMRAYLDGQGVSGVDRACVAVAGPVYGDHFSLTNAHWSFSCSAVRKRMGFRSLDLLNDWAAMAYAVPPMPDEALCPVGNGGPRPRRTLVALGPGTGLGLAALTPFGHENWALISGEGGHIAFAPLNARERDLLAVLEGMVGGRVSVERLLSGMGIESVYQALARLDGVSAPLNTAADISQAGQDGTDPLAVETLKIFSATLGSFAGDVALLMGAYGGVYLGGGILPRMKDTFLKSDFRARFEDKGRMRPLMEAMPTFLIEEDYPALHGAAEFLALKDAD
ncbi:glucokinase [Yunchengibacter salinarum]|uniref:glucokinase n=1 Tax=Yunchengibacter salinarum TaxID=3133399 RepID=UPI0035B5F6ED